MNEKLSRTLYLLLCIALMPGVITLILAVNDVRESDISNEVLAQRIAHVEQQYACLEEELNEMKRNAPMVTVPAVEPPVEPVKAATQPPKYSEAEVDMVSRIIYSEARGEPYEGQLAIAQVIVDRLECATYDFGDSIKAVCTAPKQFAKPFKGSLEDYPNCRKAAEAVLLEDERAFDTTVLFFFNPDTAATSAMKWLRTHDLVGTIGHHEFRGQ